PLEAGWSSQRGKIKMVQHQPQTQQRSSFLDLLSKVVCCGFGEPNEITKNATGKEVKPTYFHIEYVNLAGTPIGPTDTVTFETG
ncbi:unnamed protein product, partial [Amoebophrya sp. A120]